MKKIAYTCIFSFAFVATAALAQGVEDAKEAFQSIKVVSDIEVSVPTVVEVPFRSSEVFRESFMVVENETGNVLPWFFKESQRALPVPVTVSAEGGTNARHMLDNNLRTYADFPLSDTVPGSTRIVLTGTEPISSSRLSLRLAENVSLPLTVAIRAGNTSGGETTVVARKRVESTEILFPRTTARVWTIDLSYAQPLRISELDLQQDDVQEQTTRGLRFLAQPDMTYSIYYDPDRSVRVSVGERGDLRTDEGVVRLPDQYPSDSNAAYVPADVDDDGVVDTLDNCVTVANPNQTDIDENGRGDMCDDFDRDRILNYQDNCPTTPNRDQRDEDGDGLGDACDEEESRFTERHGWVPWVGMGVAVGVLVMLFVIVARGPRVGRESEHHALEDQPEEER